jgi:hypothetical protein
MLWGWSASTGHEGVSASARGQIARIGAPEGAKAVAEQDEHEGADGHPRGEERAAQDDPAVAELGDVEEGVRIPVHAGAADERVRHPGEREREPRESEPERLAVSRRVMQIPNPTNARRSNAANTLGPSQIARLRVCFPAPWVSRAPKGGHMYIGVGALVIILIIVILILIF